MKRQPKTKLTDAELEMELIAREIRGLDVGSSRVLRAKEDEKNGFGETNNSIPVMAGVVAGVAIELGVTPKNSTLILAWVSDLIVQNDRAGARHSFDRLMASLDRAYRAANGEREQ